MIGLLRPLDEGPVPFCRCCDTHLVVRSAQHPCALALCANLVAWQPSGLKDTSDFWCNYRARIFLLQENLTESDCQCSVTVQLTRTQLDTVRDGGIFGNYSQLAGSTSFNRSLFQDLESLLVLLHGEGWRLKIPPLCYAMFSRLGPSSTM